MDLVLRVRIEKWIRRKKMFVLIFQTDIPRRRRRIETGRSAVFNETHHQSWSWAVPSAIDKEQKMRKRSIVLLPIIDSRKIKWDEQVLPVLLMEDTSIIWTSRCVCSRWTPIISLGHFWWRFVTRRKNDDASDIDYDRSFPLISLDKHTRSISSQVHLSSHERPKTAERDLLWCVQLELDEELTSRAICVCVSCEKGENTANENEAIVWSLRHRRRMLSIQGKNNRISKFMLIYISMLLHRSCRLNHKHRLLALFNSVFVDSLIHSFLSQTDESEAQIHTCADLIKKTNSNSARIIEQGNQYSHTDDTYPTSNESAQNVSQSES